MKSTFSVALVAAVASAAASTASKQKLMAFNDLVMNSQWNGAPLHSSLPKAKTLLPKQNTLYSYYPDYDWMNESMLDYGCNVTDYVGETMNWGYFWTTDMDKCNSEGSWTKYCVEGYWQDDTQTQFNCSWNVYEYSEYECAKWGNCPFDMGEYLESIGEAVLESAVNNGLNPDEAQSWMETVEQAWMDLEETAQAEDAELYDEQAREAAEYLTPIIDGMVSDIAAQASTALDSLAEEVSEAAADLQDELSGISMKKYKAFNDMVKTSQFNGKALHKTLPQSKLSLKPNVLYPEYDWDNWSSLDEGCYGDNGSWTNDLSYCVGYDVSWCIEGAFYDRWISETETTETTPIFDCWYNVYSEDEYNCAKWGECDFDLESELESIAEMLGELAVENGLDPEYAENWLNDAKSAWEDLEASQQERADELAETHAGEATDMFAPIISGMIGDLSDAIGSLANTDESELIEWDDDWVVLAEKKTTKHHKHTGAYVAGGVTLVAAALGAAYLLKKRQESKGINEALIGDNYVRQQTI